MAKAMALVVLLMVLVVSTVFGEELETLPPSYPHSPTPAPHHSPSNAPHSHNHHHHHQYPPAPTTLHPPTPTPSPSPTPTHPHYPPTSAPAKPPTHHHHHHPPAPAPAPVKPPVPVHPPVKPPAVPVKPPVKPPAVPVKPPAVPVKPPVPVHPFSRSFVAVQGVVYVKSCKYAGVDTLLGASPLLGAVVKLQCNNTKYKLVQTSKTDKNGYFYIEAPKSITTYGAHKCNVVLVSAPYGLKASNLHGGLTGALLRPYKPFLSQKLPFLLYTVGPLAFQPKCH